MPAADKTNGFAQAGRMRKAMDMAGVIDRNAIKQDPPISPYDQAGRILLASHEWSDAVWLQIAKNAGYTSEKTPGPRTRDFVRDVYRSRAQAPLQKVAS